MTPTRGALRFGMLLDPDQGMSALVGAAQEAEMQGFDSVLLADHVSTISPLVSLAVIGRATSSITVGAYVLNAAFWRSPALLAREVRTVERWIGDRVELGLGAGWAHADSQAAGSWAASAEARSAHLESVVSGLRALPGSAAPAARLLLGGSGARSLALASRWADIVAFSGARRTREGELELLSVGELRTQVATVRSQIPAGRCPEFSLNVHRVSTVGHGGTGMPARVLVGSDAEVRRRILDLRDGLGISYFVVSQADAGGLAPVMAGLR